jgi:hypothetical protein
MNRRMPSPAFVAFVFAGVIYMAACVVVSLAMPVLLVCKLMGWL